MIVGALSGIFVVAAAGFTIFGLTYESGEGSGEAVGRGLGAGTSLGEIEKAAIKTPMGETALLARPFRKETKTHKNMI